MTSETILRMNKNEKVREMYGYKKHCKKCRR